MFTIILIVAAVLLARLAGRSDSMPSWLPAVIWGVAGLAWLLLAIPPFIRWFVSTDTLYSDRLESIEGVIKQHRRVISLERIAAVNVDRTLADRFFRSGTIVVQTAGHDSDVDLVCCPQAGRRVDQIRQQMELALEHRGKAGGGAASL
ncbi:MAG: PH domain-containing protein [Micrococcales bacterium]|nr:PH domain-containing protein [Micrococcales bacterium]